MFTKPYNKYIIFCHLLICTKKTLSFFFSRVKSITLRLRKEIDEKTILEKLHKNISLIMLLALQYKMRHCRWVFDKFEFKLIQHTEIPCASILILNYKLEDELNSVVLLLNTIRTNRTVILRSN